VLAACVRTDDAKEITQADSNLVSVDSKEEGIFNAVYEKQCHRRTNIGKRHYQIKLKVLNFKRNEFKSIFRRNYNKDTIITYIIEIQTNRQIVP